jgi:hypothetical protein
VPGDPVSHHQSLRAECTYSRTTRSCAKSVIRATRSQCGVPQLALGAYPADNLEDRGGVLTRFVERGYPPQKLSSPSQSLYMDMAMVMIREKGVPRDGAMSGNIGSASATKPVAVAVPLSL